MVNCASKDCSKHNVYIKVVISILITLGIICAIFAICSCRWFVFSQDQSSDKRLLQDWTFLPERDMETTISIGLFRYQNALIDDDDESLNTSGNAVNKAFVSTDKHQCTSYAGFWVGINYKWKFTSQLSIVLGTIFAFVSLCVIIVGADNFWISTFLLLTTGLQSATIISSLSWCDQYWNCPWLLGALINLMATCLFLSCWVLAMWGLIGLKRKNKNKNDSEIKINTDEQQKRKWKGKQKQKHPDQENNNQSTGPGGSYPSSVIVTNNIKSDIRNEIVSCSGEIDLGTKDLECESNTMALYYVSDQLSPESCNGEDYDKCSIMDHELYYNASFDDDIKSTMKRISQSNQTFLDLDAKLQQRRAAETLPNTSPKEVMNLPGSSNRRIDIYRDTNNTG
mmetsp:Transcript_5006/g.12839  ORF Transcript_5006/g.12839 Transcript_5006/m.12839 type:complete len:396 (-) Transcript_5006:861-2048(-)|eukprot:CAMPEP_0197173884 /NCGR_PEP_ID=MMETSP1423-20130617/636_1 /TAXON_ID=476441 /ORGANISM="Pseudo-nitzschia heimii, Strain UNC1101" /LENGTH=395 /DNA_ID=CAMNT_0042622753 /DNA_START=287 /DNA_END=1474 /DNA_ORIENTATION=-